MNRKNEPMSGMKRSMQTKRLRRRSALRIPQLLCALGLMWAGRAAASGEGIPDLGTEALGEGSAQIAQPQNLTALWYNPAGLAGLDGPLAQIDFRLTWHRVGFQRLDADGTNPQGFDPIQNQANLTPLAVVPMGGFAMPLKFMPVPFVVSVGGFPFNGATGYQYPDPAALRASGLTPEQVEQAAPQRYASIASASKIYVAALGAAARILPWLDLGADLQLVEAAFSTKQSVSAGVAPGEDSDLDAALSISGSDFFRLSGAFGATAHLPWGLLLGASYQLPYRFHATGNLTADIPPTLQGLGAQLVGSAASLSFTFPWYFRAGLRLVRPVYEIELAGTIDGWSTLDNIRIVPHGVSIELDGKSTPIPTLILPQQLQNAYSARLGGELHVGQLASWGRGLTVRAGLLYETSAVPEDRQSLSLPNWARGSLSFGFSYDIKPFTLSFAYAHFVQPERDVRDSTVKQVVALPGTAPTVVGNGDYTSQLDLFSLSVLMRF